VEAPPLQLALRQRESRRAPHMLLFANADCRFPFAQATTQPGGKCVYCQEPHARTLLGVFEGLTIGSSAGRPSGTSSRKESRVKSPQTPLLLSHPCFLAVLRFWRSGSIDPNWDRRSSLGCQREGRRGACAVLSGGEFPYLARTSWLCNLEHRDSFILLQSCARERERENRLRKAENCMDAKRRVEIDLFSPACAPLVRARQSRIPTDRLRMSAYGFECGARIPASERRLTSSADQVTRAEVSWPAALREGLANRVREEEKR
jgi:hypothetical protein